MRGIVSRHLLNSWNHQGVVPQIPKGEANFCRRMPGRVASPVLRRAVGEDRAASPKPKIAISHPMLELRT